MTTTHDVKPTSQKIGYSLKAINAGLARSGLVAVVTLVAWATIAIYASDIGGNYS